MDVNYLSFPAPVTAALFSAAAMQLVDTPLVVAAGIGQHTVVTTMSADAGGPTQRLVRCAAAAATCISLSGDGKWLATGDADGAVSCVSVSSTARRGPWSVTTGCAPAAAAVATCAHTGPVMALAWTPAGTQVLSVGCKDMKVWAISRAGRLHLVAVGALAQPVCAVVVTDALVAITAGARHLKWWDLRPLAAAASCTPCPLAPGGSTETRRSAVLPPSSPAAAVLRLTSSPAILTVSGLAFSGFVAAAGCGGGEVVSLSSAGAVCVFDRTRRLVRWAIPPGPPATSLDVMPTPSASADAAAAVAWLVIAGRGGVALLDAATLAVMRLLPHPLPVGMYGGEGTADAADASAVPGDQASTIPCRGVAVGTAAVAVRAHSLGETGRFRVVAAFSDGGTCAWTVESGAPRMLDGNSRDTSVGVRCADYARHDVAYGAEAHDGAVARHSAVVVAAAREVCVAGGAASAAVAVLFLPRGGGRRSSAGCAEELVVVAADGCARAWATLDLDGRRGYAVVARRPCFKIVPSPLWVTVGDTAISSRPGAATSRAVDSFAAVTPRPPLVSAGVVCDMDGSLVVVLSDGRGAVRLLAASSAGAQSLRHATCCAELWPPLLDGVSLTAASVAAPRVRGGGSVCGATGGMPDSARSICEATATAVAPRLIISASSASVHLYRCAVGASPWWAGIQHAGSVPGPVAGLCAAALSIDEQTLIVAACDGPVAVWRLLLPAVDTVATDARVRGVGEGPPSRSAVARLVRTTRHSGAARVVDIVPEPAGRHAVGVSEDYAVHVWSLRSGCLLRSLAAMAPTHGIASRVAIDRSGLYVAIGGADGSVDVVDYFTGEALLERARIGGAAVSALAFSPRCSDLVVATADGCVAASRLPPALARASRRCAVELRPPTRVPPCAPLTPLPVTDATAASPETRTNVSLVLADISALPTTPRDGDVICVDVADIAAMSSIGVGSDDSDGGGAAAAQPPLVDATPDVGSSANLYDAAATDAIPAASTMRPHSCSPPSPLHALPPAASSGPIPSSPSRSVYPTPTPSPPEALVSVSGASTCSTWRTATVPAAAVDETRHDVVPAERELLERTSVAEEGGVPSPNPDPLTVTSVAEVVEDVLEIRAHLATASSPALLPCDADCVSPSSLPHSATPSVCPTADTADGDVARALPRIASPHPATVTATTADDAITQCDAALVPLLQLYGDAHGALRLTLAAAIRSIGEACLQTLDSERDTTPPACNRTHMSRRVASPSPLAAMPHFLGSGGAFAAPVARRPPAPFATYLPRVLLPTADRGGVDDSADDVSFEWLDRVRPFATDAALWRGMAPDICDGDDTHGCASSNMALAAVAIRTTQVHQVGGAPRGSGDIDTKPLPQQQQQPRPPLHRCADGESPPLIDSWKRGIAWAAAATAAPAAATADIDSVDCCVMAGNVAARSKTEACAWAAHSDGGRPAAAPPAVSATSTTSTRRSAVRPSMPSDDVEGHTDGYDDEGPAPVAGLRQRTRGGAHDKEASGGAARLRLDTSLGSEAGSALLAALSWDAAPYL